MSQVEAGGTAYSAKARPRVIVVDDEPVIASTIVQILNGEGFEALSATRGEVAVELAREVQPDIVLSDVIMPGLSGIEAGIKIREFLPNCRIVLLSGQADTVDLLGNAEAEGHQFEVLAKPIDPEVLIAILRGEPGVRPAK